MIGYITTGIVIGLILERYVFDYLDFALQTHNQRKAIKTSVEDASAVLFLRDFDENRVKSIDNADAVNFIKDCIEMYDENAFDEDEDGDED